MVLGQSNVASNGGTWFTAQRMNSYFSWNRRTRSSSWPCWTIACATSVLLSASPASISPTASIFSWSRLAANSDPYVAAVRKARIVRKIESAPARSGAMSSTTQPRASNVLRWADSTARTRASSGSPPRSGHQATRVPRKLRLRGPRNAAGSDGMHAGSRGSGPAITLSSHAVSDTVLAMGPLTEKPTNGNAVGAVGTSPTVGRNPTTLLKLPGFLSEPPMSLPSAIGSMPVASAAAAPPLDPPALLVGSYGLTVVPYTLL